MNSAYPDIQLIRILFSRAIQAGFGFANSSAQKNPVLRLVFDFNASKMALLVFDQLKEHLQDDRLKLSFLENNGDFLTISFLWDRYPAIFSSTPDYYSKKDYLNFIRNVFYNDSLALSFQILKDGREMPLSEIDSAISRDTIPLIYYQRIS